MSDGGSRADPVGQLAEDFMARYRRGERPALTEYTERYPELADRIRDVFPMLVVMEEADSRSAPSQDATGLGPVEAPDREGERIAGYRILREVGRGGMGVVYEAEQLALGRHVALKVLPDLIAQNPRGLERFRREARAAARLHHTNIVPVYEVGQDGGVVFYAMQFIQGQPLDVVLDELKALHPPPGGPAPAPAPAPAAVGAAAEVTRSLLTEITPAGAVPEAEGLRPPLPKTECRSGPPDSAEGAASGSSSAVLPGQGEPSAATAGRRPFDRSVARVGVQVAEAVAYAHREGVIHRDIKPSNLLLDADGRVWITDFGLAKTDGDALTHTGDLIGTLRYMAPERFRGWSDPRSDVYSLGLTLYEMLLLRPAFGSADRLKLIHQVAHDDPVPPRQVDPKIPRDLETIVLKAIDKEPSRRYQSAEELAADLRRFLADEPIRARRVGPWERAVLWARRRPAEAALAAVGSLAALALIATAVSLWYQGQLSKERDSARKFQYFQHMALANTAWRDGNMGRLEQLLDDCPAEHQGHWEWRYLKRQCHRESLRLEGHTGAVFEITYSRDGKLMASASLDYTARLWDTATGRLLQTFRGHENAVDSVAFCPEDETRLATTGWDGTVRIWDTTTGREVDRFECGLMLWDIAYSPDGKRIAAAGSDGTVRVWDLSTRKLAEWPGGHGPAPFGVRKVRFSPDGKWLASTGANGKVNLWDAKTGRVKFPLSGHGDALVIGVVFSPKGEYLATASFDRTVRVWEVATGQPAGAGILKGHDNVVWGVAFSPDGRWLASSSADPSVKLWDWRSGEELRTLRCHGGAVHDVAFSPDGTRLATASHDLTIKFWDLAEVPEARVLAGHTGAVNGVAFHPAGRILASAGQDKTIRLWDLATGLARTLPPGHDAAVLCVAFSPGGEILASGDKKGVVRLWDTATGRMSQALPDDHGGEVSALAFRPDGECLATAGKDGRVRIWEIRTLRKATYPGHLRAVTTLAYRPDGYLASGGEDRKVIVRDATGRVAYSNGDHTCFVHSVAYGPDGRYFSTAPGPAPEDPIKALLVSVSGDGSLLIWDETTNRKRPIKAHGSDVWSVAFSPDGTRLASASLDFTIKLWDLVSGAGQTVDEAEVLSLKGHTGGVLGVVFSPDGNLLASAGRDGTVRLWDASPWPLPSPGRGIDPGGTRRP